MISFDFVYNPCLGLGDCLSCFNTNKPVWSPSPHFSALKKYSSVPTLDAPEGVALSITQLHNVDFAGQHLFNRVRTISGMAPLSEPHAILDLVKHDPIPNNVAYSFDVGAHVAYQRTNVHPRARELYPEHRATVQEFISRNASKFNFIEVGSTTFNFDHSLYCTGVGLEKTIEILRKCRFYFGMHSGLMHLATAIGLRCLILVNMPKPEIIDFRKPENIEQNQEMHWLYPQHVILHEDALDAASQVSLENLENFILQ